MNDDENENDNANNRINNNKTITSTFFEYKTKIIGSTPKSNNILDAVSKILRTLRAVGDPPVQEVETTTTRATF